MKITRSPLRSGGSIPPKSANLGLRLTPSPQAGFVTILAPDGSELAKVPCGETYTVPPSGNQVRVIYDGVDPPEGLLVPADATELYLSAGDSCTTRLDHNGVTPVGSGEFEFAEVGYCTETELTLNSGDTIGSIPACIEYADITITCVDGVPTLELRDAQGELIGTADLSTLLPPTEVHLNGDLLGTVSRCATQIDLSVEGVCELIEVDETPTCVGSATVTVDADTGESYSAGVGC